MTSWNDTTFLSAVNLFFFFHWYWEILYVQSIDKTHPNLILFQIYFQILNVYLLYYVQYSK